MAIKNKIILTLVASFFLIVLMIVLIVFPLLDRIKNNSQELINKKQKTASLTAETFNLERFNNLDKEVESFLSQIDKLFIDSKVPIEFINFLEETSEKTNVEIESLNLSDQKLNQDYWPSLVFQISCQASFADFQVFLEKLENNPYLVEVQNMTITKLSSDQEDSSRNIRASFSLKVFTKI
jgi:Tfp pilus assembly protein PilO